MSNIIYEKIDVEDVHKHGREKYNSNNHKPKPDDYYDKLEMGNTKNWIDIFHDDYETVTIDDEKEIKWMLDSQYISIMNCKFSQLFEDEMEQFLEKYNVQFDIPKFIRFENVSLKCGQHGVGPYKSMKEIIESLVSCSLEHTPLYRETKKLTIYVLPWKDIHIKDEFRVFVYNNKITCISQQDPYNKYDQFTQVYIELISNIITGYFNNKIKDKFTHINSYSYDFYVDPITRNPYFIEMNTFGTHYSAGSSLFHWILNEDKLYSDGSTVCFRYI